MAKSLYKKLVTDLTDRNFLKKVKLSKKAMLEILEKEDWYQKAEALIKADSETFCTEVFKICQPTMDGLTSPVSRPPEEGWLPYIYQCILGELFPAKKPLLEKEAWRTAKEFYLRVLHSALSYERQRSGFSPAFHFDLLPPEEVIEKSYNPEYLRFLQLQKELHIYEFMRIGSEITPFNTLGHIAGVHFISMHIAKQMEATGIPIDLGVVSGAAAGHDIGKYGCKESEARRIPYLHYYYTDQCFNRFSMPFIGHIAANHSTWDLELENLSAESLVLIYADFRVKSSRNDQNKEIIHFYNLKESFDVILGKLDNVDSAKEKRYRKVYAKLRDFEAYIESQGVNTDLCCSNINPPGKKDQALLRPEETVSAIKHLAIAHNIKVMNKFSKESEFGSLIEAAGTERQWKKVRAYMDILEEYSTYMTGNQKKMTLQFCYGLLMHKEGDIRRQAAGLMGMIIANFDEAFNKELPEGETRPLGQLTALQIWENYLKNIILPGHKVTDQHKRWIGYSLKIVIASLLCRAKHQDLSGFLDVLTGWYKECEVVCLAERSGDDPTAFILMDSMLSVPLSLCSEEQKEAMIAFATKGETSPNIEVSMAASGFLRKTFNLGIPPEALKRPASEIFLENLKASTPWIIKIQNIENLLARSLGNGANGNGLVNGSGSGLHTATHLANLLKVSERVTVRHAAGNGLLKIVDFLPLDQINEIAVELSKGLEIGEYQFSKYIPEYLGRVALKLHPNELDELIIDLRKMFESTNEKVATVALATMGVIIIYYPGYEELFPEASGVYETRRKDLIGHLLRGLANYNEVVSNEALLVLGQIFKSDKLDLAHKFDIFSFAYKKIFNIIMEAPETELSFYGNAATLNHMYRFISEYQMEKGEMQLFAPGKVAFFPGTFDPFSLGHKGIVREIRSKGFEVYLALDEFSWSKNAQPRMHRRQIMAMSMAEDGDVYLFPDDFPVNIASPEDLKKLKSAFSGREVYMVVGSDVVCNASSYKAPPTEDSIHTFNHIIFQRESLTGSDREVDSLVESALRSAVSVPGTASGPAVAPVPECANISGKTLYLTLPRHLEDISSTGIRENIDLNRDISSLIDPICQNFIYSNSLYLREPLYKHVMEANRIQIEPLAHRGGDMLSDLVPYLAKMGKNINKVMEYLDREDVRCLAIRDNELEGKVVGLVATHSVDTMHLYEEFKDASVAAFVRSRAGGPVAILGGLYYSPETKLPDIQELLLSEVLAQLLKEDFHYGVFHDCTGDHSDTKVVNILTHQGFVKIPDREGPGELFVVDMNSPVVLFQNLGTVIKPPFNSNPRMIEVLKKAHGRLQESLNFLYPGELILSIHSGILHHKLVEMITRENGMPGEILEPRQLGSYMCVPFGNILDGRAVPNTVTKTLHTEKCFNEEVSEFTIEQRPFYSPLENQVRTIKSFNRPVILVDDLLHKGYRMKKLDPLFKENDVEVSSVIVGVLSGQGRDLMKIQGRKADSAYFLPNLKLWFVESLLYPFIGGDSIKIKGQSQGLTPVQGQAHPQLQTSGLALTTELGPSQNSGGLLPSINLILPYVRPTFLQDIPGEKIYNFSMVCLENAMDILRTMEEEYQALYQKKLTLERLGEVLIMPREPVVGSFVNYDRSSAPSAFIDNDIARLVRLQE